MDSHKILSLLGLALRGNHLAVGEEPVEAAARAKEIGRASCRERV